MEEGQSLIDEILDMEPLFGISGINVFCGMLGMPLFGSFAGKNVFCGKAMLRG